MHEQQSCQEVLAAETANANKERLTLAESRKQQVEGAIPSRGSIPPLWTFWRHVLPLGF